MDRMTSHLDIPPTVMNLLGVKSPPEDYSLGFDLLGNQHREYTVLTDWNRICYVDQTYKAVYPYKGPLLQNIITTRNDQPVADATDFTSANQNRLMKVMGELGKFNR